MSEPKFTPGPWRIFDTHPEKACFYIDRADQIPGHAIGEVAVIYTTTDDTKRANARLIAAAPDLYAALRGLLQSAGFDWIGGVDVDAAAEVAVNAARDALTKAARG